MLSDTVINWISPKWGLERRYWRDVNASYKGGVPTRTSEGWTQATGYRFGSATDRYQALSTRDRAYQAYDNNPVARAIIETETDNVIGDGLNFQPASDSPDWNREAEDRYYQWLEECSLRGSDAETGCDIQRQIWSYSRIAGDIGWVLVSRGSDSRIQLVRSENIVTPDGMLADPEVFDGIRFDQFGKPTTFYILYRDDRTGKRTFTAIDARDFVWFPHMTKPGQARPPSLFATVFDLLAHLDRYIDGVSLAAWMGTVFGIVFKQNNRSTQMQGLPTLTNSHGNQQKAVTFENGMVKYVGTDEEVAQVQATQPMQQAPDHVRMLLRQIGQPFRMPLEVIALDLSTANFASARIGLIPWYARCRVNAGKFGSRWSRTIRWWLSRERLRADDDPKKWKTKFPENYWAHSLLPNAWDYTDPVSEVQSDMMQVDAGFKSVQMVISERGHDADKIRLQRQAWQEQGDEDGLTEAKSTLTRDAVPPVSPADTAADPSTDPNANPGDNANAND